MTSAPPSSPFAILDFRYFFTIRLAVTLSATILAIVIGWQVYDTARQTMSLRHAAFWLGMVGLAQFLPLFLLTLIAGYAADRIDRRLILRLSLLLEFFCALALFILTWSDQISLHALFIIAGILGVARAFANPAMLSFTPNIVPTAMVPSAIAWGSIAWQTGAIGGPPLGGYLYAFDPSLPYATTLVLLGLSLLCAILIRPIPRGEAAGMSPWRAMREGLGYVRRNRVIIGAISLDLFAVLLGGATALLPIYARDILHVGPEGLGHLRAAPAVGATLTAFILTRRPLHQKAGIKMFACVATFGVATIIFGLSQNFWLSLGALTVLGAADMVSVYVRSSLVQLHTPDKMRGRVGAVSQLFISASNELGEFESGVTAAWLGPVTAVVVGGVGAIIITILWAWKFPELRRIDRLSLPDD